MLRWDKPKDWDNIISSIRDSLKIRISSIRDISKKRGLADDVINERVSKIEENSSRISSIESSFVPPTDPIANGCVFHSRDSFTEWSEPEKECYLGFISVVVEVACQEPMDSKKYCRKSYI